jgi:hypothetical protein
MTTNRICKGIAAALLAWLSLGCVSAGAQSSLALTYKLNAVDSTRSAPVPAPIHRCAGLNWGPSLEQSCDRQALAGAAATTRSVSESDAPRSQVANPGVFAARARLGEVMPAAAEVSLPDLPIPASDARGTRSAGGSEALTGNVKTVDLMFRFGSKYRMRSADEGWEVYRFSDTSYDTRDSRVPSTGARAVAVELLVPFQ